MPLLREKILCTSLWKGKGAEWFKRRSSGIADLVHSYIFSNHGVILHTSYTCEASREMGVYQPTFQIAKAEAQRGSVTNRSHTASSRAESRHFPFCGYVKDKLFSLSSPIWVSLVPYFSALCNSTNLGET